MIIGFTGSQNGMTLNQATEFAMFIDSMKIDEFVHGDCIGADRRANDIVRILSPETFITIWPGFTEGKRAFCTADNICRINPKLYKNPNIERNHRIVDSCDVLIACPSTKEEVLRSGTWATIRYARKIGRKIEILNP